MKAITLYQPWASLIADKRKPEETRPRPWHYNGRVAIHAGMRVDRNACVKFGYDADSIPRGAIVCTVNKNGCVQFPNSTTPPNEYGNFTAGRFGYTFDDVKKLLVPIPAKGSQGIWNWNPNYKTELRIEEEFEFFAWVHDNNIPWGDYLLSDYDMRGFWLKYKHGLVNRAADGHFPDTWKTPFHETFSNESIYAFPGAPHWEGDRLVF